MVLIPLLIALIVFCAVLWAVRAIVAAFGIGDPIATLIQVVVVLLAVAWLVEHVAGASLGSVFRLR